MRIAICICTCRRPALRRGLAALAAQRMPRGVAAEILVIDNDDSPSAMARASRPHPLPLRYIHAPGRDIARARNAALDATRAGWIAWLDDDTIPEPGWLAALVARARETGADAVFGPSLARYGPATPSWIARGDFHSQRPAPRGGHVETGHCCNALMRWGDAPWRRQRFDPARGRTGGEDTEFFLRLRRRHGARYALAPGAVVHEPVTRCRARLGWLLARRFRSGQSYAARASHPAARLGLGLAAALRALLCLALVLPCLRTREGAAAWLLRATLHAGVCAGCLALPQPMLHAPERG